MQRCGRSLDCELFEEGDAAGASQACRRWYRGNGLTSCVAGHPAAACTLQLLSVIS